MNRSLYSFLHIKWSNKDENWKQLKQFDMYLEERQQLSFVTLKLIKPIWHVANITMYHIKEVHGLQLT